MAAENGDNKDTKVQVFRKPNCILWTATALVIIFAVWSVLLLTLAASGHLLNSLSFECGKNKEEFLASRLEEESRLVYLWSGLSLPVCILLLLEFWRKKGFYTTALLGGTSVLLVIMCLSFYYYQEKEAQDIEEFKNMTEWRYLASLPLRDTPRNTQNQGIDKTCDMLNNVYRWQAEFKCCGVQGYQDWKSSFPDSCLCNRKDNSSGCVGVGNIFVHEKPCLPTVLSLVEKRRTTFWAIMILWISITGTPVAICGLVFVSCIFFGCYVVICESFCDELRVCIHKMRGGVVMVPVVFIRKNNNNETEEENRNDREEQVSGMVDGVVSDIEGGTNAEGEGRQAAEDYWYENPVTHITPSELRRLQEELDPPPVPQISQCPCPSSLKPATYYKILIEDGSPLLPSGAVLVDADKAARLCWLATQNHGFDIIHLGWPRSRRSSISVM